MTVLKPDFLLFVNDTLLSAGLGIWASLCYHIFIKLVPAKKLFLGIVLYILFFAVFGLFLFFFIVGKTYVAQPRWFIFFGLLVGGVAYYAGVSPFVSLALRFIFRINRRIKAKIKRCFVLIFGLIASVYLDIVNFFNKMALKRKHTLKNKREMLYNKRKEMELEQLLHGGRDIGKKNKASPPKKAIKKN